MSAGDDLFADNPPGGFTTPQQKGGYMSPEDQTARYQGMGAAAQDRQAFGLNWRDADAARQQGLGARDQQGEAMSYARYVANGGQTQADITGRNQLNTGLQNQQAVAMSARGGSLAQAAAMRQQQNDAAGFMQSGQQQLDAQHAMAQQQAQQQYMQMSGQMRQGDLSQQDMDEQRAIEQQKSELAQRQLNDQAQMGYEQMGQDAAVSGLQQQTHNSAVDANTQAAYAQSEQQDKDRDQKKFAAAVSAIPLVGGPIAGWSSDARMKQNTYVLSDARAKQEAYDLGVMRGMSAGPEVRNAPAGMTGTRANQNKPTEGRAASAGMARAAMAQRDPGLVASTKRAVEQRLDPMTNAIADGLAPHAWQYKPEVAPREGQLPGEQNVGIIAQKAAANPITGTMVKQQPDGMLAIDQKKATSLALAAAGHNAQRLREQQAQIDQFKGGVR